MSIYTIQQRLNLYECFIRNNKSPALALREYRRLYPNSRIPSKKIFVRIIRDLENGVVINNKRNRPRTVLTEENQLDVLLYFEESNENSQRDAARDIPHISRASIQRTLNINDYHPFKFTPVQELSIADFDNRATFCMDMMDRHFDQPVFDKILFTDEAIFNTSGIFNRKNCHYWSRQNQHKIKAIRKQGHQSVYVWCGIIKDRVIGPVFYDRTLNGQRYHSLLQNEIQPLINELPDEIKDGLVFQQDSAPYHTVRPVIEWLNERFPMWIGRFGSIPWPARSPDLTPLDFFLWGNIKDKVYKNKVNNVDDLRGRIMEEIHLINESEAVRRAIEKLDIIYTTCIAQEGGYIENLI